MVDIMMITEQCRLVERLNVGPVLCWVTNGHFNKPFVRLVVKVFDLRFYVDSGEYFNFARVLSAGDIDRFLMCDGN
jgi:hypothetical protein